MVRREVFDKIGLLDEDFSPAYWEDPEFCVRALKEKFTIKLCVGHGIIHEAHTTLKPEDHLPGIERNKDLFISKVRKPTTTGNARVLVLADNDKWAWGRKANAYKKHLDGKDFTVDVGYHEIHGDYGSYDIIHLFEVSQIDLVSHHIPKGWKGKLVAGLTAHVWRTWGAEKMKQWASQVVALHGNSLLLVNELKQFHDRVYYTPNGVDPDLFCRKVPHYPQFIAAYVGKPTPRKGFDTHIKPACAKAEVLLETVVKTSQDPSVLTPEQMVDFYQKVWVQVCASDLDGTPNGHLESASCENALLSTRIGNMPEFIIDGYNGFLVERDIDSLANRLEWFKNHPEETLEMGRNARKTVLRGWTWEINVRHVERMWREVLS